MKPFLSKGLLATWLGLALALSPFASAQTSPTPKSEPTASPAASASPSGKKGKTPRNPNDPTPTPKIKKPKEIPFPVPIGKNALKLKVPSYDQAGKLLSMLDALKAHRLDNENVQMDGMNFDLSPGDDKNEYKVEMPTSVLNLKTNIITSDNPVVIRTKDFELSGERVKFDTVERTGELLGHVHMTIHNLKQVATPEQPSNL